MDFDLLARGANDARLSDCSAVSQSSSSLDLDSSSDAKVGKQDRYTPRCSSEGRKPESGG